MHRKWHLYQAVKLPRESHPTIQTPASVFEPIYRQELSPNSSSTLEMQKVSGTTDKVRGPITSTLLGEAWQNLPVV